MAQFSIRKISFSVGWFKKHEIDMDFGLESGFISIDFGHETSGRLTPLEYQSTCYKHKQFQFLYKSNNTLFFTCGFYEV